jgi:DNA-binding response OmpR family regulator
LARALRKSGIETCDGLRAEKSADAIIVEVPGLVDSAETAAHLAAAKHLLDTYIAKPVILKPVPKRENVVAPPEQFQQHRPLAAAAAASD